MTAYFFGLWLLMFLAYGVFCVLAPEKHLALSAWWSRRRRREWHKHRAYTTPDLRMERRQSQYTPANLWRIRVTGIGFLVIALWGMWAIWKIHR
jgi:hypothetical protein